MGIPARAVSSGGVEALIVILLGVGWELLRFFMAPVIALTTAGTVTAARRSVHLVRLRWALGLDRGTVTRVVHSALDSLSSRFTRLEQSQRLCAGDRVRPRRRAELAVQLARVGLHRVQRDIQLGADLASGQAGR